MKKMIALLLTALLVLSLAACGSAPAKIADDTAVLALNFTRPETYVNVTRSVTTGADGTLTEKDIVYKIDDDTVIGYAVMPDTELKDVLDTEGKDTRDAGGATFYLMTGDTYQRGVAQYGKDIYAVAYQYAEGGSADLFDKVMESLSFTDVTETKLNDDPENLYEIKWSFDEAWTLLSFSSDIEEDAEGAITNKSCSWSFNDDKENPDNTTYCFGIDVYKNQTLDDVRDSEKEYEDKEVNGITYSVLKGEETPYRYYIQRGEDVYRVVNIGLYNGLWYTRSDESFEAFDKFLNSISFG